MCSRVRTRLLIVATTVFAGCTSSDQSSDRDVAAEARLLAYLKKEHVWVQSDGSYELKVRDVDGDRLIGLEIKYRKDGNVSTVLKSLKSAHIKIKKDAWIMTILVEECTFETDGQTGWAANQAFDLPSPELVRR